MSLDPIRTTELIRDTYVRYLTTAFPIRHGEIAQQFKSELTVPDRFVKGPILEATPPFATGATIRELVDDGVLCRSMLRLNSEYLPVDRPLYQHQEQAIRKVVAYGRNIVVATGTGSGKTEAFLIPVLDHLLRDASRGRLGPGVRALLLYPMNALANDQLKRLRRLLAHVPEVTFGRYTGDTKEKPRIADEHFRRNYPNERRLPNELRSREDMRTSPPHILLTNYAMLEYLLLRPKDCEFFDGAAAGHWRFLVIDEAHTYDGAKGIEVAMLIRRLKDRVVHSEPGRLQCVVTSATLGRGPEDYPATVRFCREVLRERFEWDDKDSRRQDVVEGQRLPLAALEGEWGRPDHRLYLGLQRMTTAPNEPEMQPISDLAAGHGVPHAILRAAIEASDTSREPVNRFLYDLLKGDGHLGRLRDSLAEGPRFISEIAGELFPALDIEDALQSLAALVDLAARARPSQEASSLLPARYHVFARSLEGAFLSLEPHPKLYLDRRQSCEIDGASYPVFEAAICRRCGALYLVGTAEPGGGSSVLRQSSSRGDETERDRRLTFLLLEEPGQAEPAFTDEDELIASGEEAGEGDGDIVQLCGFCGTLVPKGSLEFDCSCSGHRRRHWQLRSLAPRDGQVSHCIQCGTSGSPGVISRFATGQDAPVSVLVTALYQQLPARAERTPRSVRSQSPADEWAVPRGTLDDHSGESRLRQLLLFSDSRQDAAFFAPYLERTYNQILRRRLVVRTLEQHAGDIRQQNFRVQDLVAPLLHEAESAAVFGPELSRWERRSEVWRWLLLELRAADRRNSLEGLGILSFSLTPPSGWVPPVPLLRAPWGLGEDEVWTLYQLLLDSFRTQGALTLPEGVSADDQVFAPRNYEYYFRENGPSRLRHIFSWLPSSGTRPNRRLDLLQRLTARRTGSHPSDQDCLDALDGIWRNLVSVWEDHLQTDTVSGEGVVYRLRHEFYDLRSQLADPSVQWHQCQTCGYLTLHSLAGVCPTYRCPGELAPCDPDEELRGNHYRELYTTLQPLPLSAEEHTAQLTADAAAELQDRFVRGEVNVLSCSTTFELGVDVGELESVVMRNVPPSAASYLQRAGRAGRRTTSTAFSLTYAQLRSHDLVHFHHPMRMIAGRIAPPRVAVRNEKIVRRHVHAMALAAFWQERRDLFGDVKAFCFTDGPTGVDALGGYLERRPPALKAALERVVPPELQDSLGIGDWSWVAGLLGEEGGSLRIADEEVRADVRALTDAREALIRENRHSDYILRILNTIYGRSIIDFMSSHNVLPKYGFPVDVVALQILDTGEEARRLELDRDLRIALSEYAPGGSVVAGGRVWTSYGIKLLPNREWPRYRYAICDHCQCYQRVLAEAEADAPLEFCVACGESLAGRRNRGFFITPEFGFVTRRERPSFPGESRPERTYTSRVFFSGESVAVGDVLEVLSVSTSLKLTVGRNGRMAVLNRAGFKVCHRCGFAIRADQPTPRSHQSPSGRECRGTLRHEDLGHEFLTDIVDLRFEGLRDDRTAFWLSLLYALLEGASEALQVSRDDLDGCLYTHAGDPSRPATILFDDVPGGAGHVQRIADRRASVLQVLKAARDRVAGRCGCAPDSSCYGCLRNYGNQFCHDDLSRGNVATFLSCFLDGCGRIPRPPG